MGKTMYGRRIVRDVDFNERMRSVMSRDRPVVLDSAAVPGFGATKTLIGWDPVEVISGGFAEIAKLAVRHSELTGAGSQGALIGTIDYEGAWSFAYYPELAVFDHDCGTWGNSPPTPGILNTGSANTTIELCEFARAFTSDVAQRDYEARVRIAQEHIAAGNIYQVNLAHEFRAPFTGSPADYFLKLRESTRAPHCAFLDQGHRQIASASPECFLQLRQQAIVTSPIKGTRPRGESDAEDARFASELIASPKERAELLMITDLERNDLGQVCEPGSIKVLELFALRRHSHVLHLVSTIWGELRHEIGHVEALASCFPGGSITGAPKLSAMRIIHEIERRDRGLYTGAIGYLGMDGESRFSIAIRTMIFENGEAHFHVGAGIVADSDPEAEYRETLVKARSLLETAGAQIPS
jgi:aminodeoxychorismate synthase component I